MGELPINLYPPSAFRKLLPISLRHFTLGFGEYIYVCREFTQLHTRIGGGIKQKGVGALIRRGGGRGGIATSQFGAGRDPNRAWKKSSITDTSAQKVFAWLFKYHSYL